MESWKQRLYDTYVSGGQANLVTSMGGRLSLGDYPYYVRMIRDVLPRDFRIAIADIACGHGALLFCLKEMGYRNVDGVDLSMEQVELAHRLGIPEVRQGSAEEFLSHSANQFDAVFMMDILEHLSREDSLRVLDAVHRSLRSGGKLVLHVPNAEGLFGMRILYGDFTHETCFTPRSIKQVLHCVGFSDVQSIEDVPPVHGVLSLGRALLWRLLTIVPRLQLMAETGTRSHVLSQCMLVVGSKRDGDLPL